MDRLSLPPRRSESISVTKDFSYPIDYAEYDTEEITRLIAFLDYIDAIGKGRIEPDPRELRNRHREFRSIVNNKTEEKRIDRSFEKLTGVSIYKTVRKYDD